MLHFDIFLKFYHFELLAICLIPYYFMTKKAQSQFEEKRFALRMAFHLPIIVSGKSADGTAWSEPTETDDMSTTGVLFHLNRKISADENISIRSHRSDGLSVDVAARVMRTSKTVQGTNIVAAAVTGSMEDWLCLFSSWAAEDKLGNEKTKGD